MTACPQPVSHGITRTHPVSHLDSCRCLPLVAWPLPLPRWSVGDPGHHFSTSPPPCLFCPLHTHYWLTHCLFYRFTSFISCLPSGVLAPRGQGCLQSLCTLNVSGDQSRAWNKALRDTCLMNDRRKTAFCCPRCEFP